VIWSFKAVSPVALACLLAQGAEALDLFLCQVLDADEMVAALAHPDQLVQLGLDSRAVTVLGVLDEEHHHEGHDGRARIDDQLPCIGKAEQGALAQATTIAAQTAKVTGLPAAAATEFAALVNACWNLGANPPGCSMMPPCPTPSRA
jgi:hypothetical protein